MEKQLVIKAFCFSSGRMLSFFPRRLCTETFGQRLTSACPIARSGAPMPFMVFGEVYDAVEFAKSNFNSVLHGEEDQIQIWLCEATGVEGLAYVNPLFYDTRECLERFWTDKSRGSSGGSLAPEGSLSALTLTPIAPIGPKLYKEEVQYNTPSEILLYQ